MFVTNSFVLLLSMTLMNNKSLMHVKQVKAQSPHADVEVWKVKRHLKYRLLSTVVQNSSKICRELKRSPVGGCGNYERVASLGVFLVT
ncbi:hypothetical protein TNCV_3632831 [Trichonephila clavipes]|nr:hypothetical protein TNCV_3632831 [Trichonephila clavipes]